MYGNGRPRPITSGVRTGNTWRSNRSASSSRSAGDACSGVRIRIPCSASAGRSSRSTVRPARSRWSSTRVRIAARISVGDIPSAAFVWVPDSIMSWRLATRTMNSSSMFDSQIAANLTRSSSGTEASSASCRTRSLKSSQDSSRLK